MGRESLPLELAQRLAPERLRGWLDASGWGSQPGRAGLYDIRTPPGEPNYQVLAPAHRGLADYGEVAAEAVLRIARHLGRQPREFLAGLLLPPADRFTFRPVVGSGASLPLAYLCALLAGARRALLAAGASEEALRGCEAGAAEGAPFGVAVSVPLDAAGEARRATAAVMRSLVALAGGEAGAVPEALRAALASMRPPGAAPALEVSASWEPPSTGLPGQARLGPAAFDSLAEEPLAGWHVGFVEELRGRPTADGRPAGETRVAVTRGDEVLRARLDLCADDYAQASAAHLSNSPVYFRGVLERSGGAARVAQAGPLLVVQRPALPRAS